MLSFADNTIVCIENPKDSTEKLLQIICEFSKVAGCKINTPKSVVFIYTTNKTSGKKKNKTIPFTIASEIRYLGINLTQEVKATRS